MHASEGGKKRGREEGEGGRGGREGVGEVGGSYRDYFVATLFLTSLTMPMRVSMFCLLTGLQGTLCDCPS